MSKDLAVISAKDYAIMKPEVDIKEVISANLGGETIDVSNFTRVKIPTGGITTWQLPSIEGDKSVEKFTGIIIHTVLTRKYYRDEYDGSKNPPDCFSDDAITGVGDPGGNCLGCPNEKFGSGKGDSQACALVRVMFILPEKEIFPIVLNVSPGSVKLAKEYMINLTSRNLKIQDVVTEFSLVKKTNKKGIDYSQVQFRIAEEVPMESREAIQGYVEAIKPILVKNARTVAQAPADDIPFSEAA